MMYWFLLIVFIFVSLLFYFRYGTVYMKKNDKIRLIFSLSFSFIFPIIILGTTASYYNAVDRFNWLTHPALIIIVSIVAFVSLQMILYERDINE